MDVAAEEEAMERGQSCERKRVDWGAGGKGEGDAEEEEDEEDEDEDEGEGEGGRRRSLVTEWCRMWYTDRRVERS